MADDVEMIPVSAEEPPKVNPLAKVAGAPGPTVKLNPVVRKAGATTVTKPLAGAAQIRPGLKLPTKTTLRPNLKLPAKPVIRKPGATLAAKPLPKPINAAPAGAAKSEAPAPVPAKPIGIDAAGVAKLPTVEGKAIARDDNTPVVSDAPKPIEALKSVTQKLKGITQQIPQQAILHKTGIIADAAMSESQKEAAKHKTARISLSDAIGVAPVKHEATPMKTICIKRPIGITTASKPPVAPAAAPTDASAEKAPAASEASSATEAPKTEAPEATSITQCKTLKITRPSGGIVRPAGKFGIKRPAPAATPSQAETVVKDPAAPAGEVADIPEIPELPELPTPAKASVSDGPAWLYALSAVVQAAACVAIGALAYFLYENTITQYF